MTSTLRHAVVAVLALGACVSTANAAFTGLYVFGDSLSDVGNVQAATTALAPLVPVTPGPYYSNGRFSNGANFTETLSAGLGLGAVTNSLSGGNNYAYGGAQTTGTSFPASLVVQDVDDQVAQYLTAHPAASASGLYVVYAGANDLNGGQTDVSVPVQSLAASIDRLYDAGARSVLAPNLPLLGLVPRNNTNPALAAGANALAMQYNSVLATALNDLEATHAGLKIYRLDVAGLFSNLVANPAAYGLTNVTQAAAPGLQPGAQTYNTALLAPNPDQYLFWDDLHPTRAGHALLGQAALAAVPEPTSAAMLLIGGLALLRRRRLA